MKKIIVLAAAMLVLVTPVWANLLADPGFESGVFGNGIGSWAQWKGTNSAFSTDYALSGAQSLRIFGGGEHGVYQTVSVTPGTQYVLAVNAMGDLNYVGWKFGSGGTQWETAPVNKDYNEWKHQEYAFTPTADTLTIYLSSESGGFPAYWDDFTLVPEPGTLVTLAGALAGMAGAVIRRRR